MFKKKIPFTFFLVDFVLHALWILLFYQKRKLKTGDTTQEKMINGESEKSFKKPKMPTDKDKQLQKK